MKFPTEYGRTLATRRTPQSLIEIYWEGGGELPNMLSGLFTSEEKAAIVIKNYIELSKPPVKGSARVKGPL